MLLNKQKLNFTDRILDLLKPMGNIEIFEAAESKYLSKGKITFAKIIHDQVFLRAPVDYGYIAIEEKTIQNKDLFLMNATKSYWFAKEEQKKLSQSD